jgi:hypothetical protein
MKRTIFLLIAALTLLACEKKPVTPPIPEGDYIPMLTSTSWTDIQWMQDFDLGPEELFIEHYEYMGDTTFNATQYKIIYRWMIWKGQCPGVSDKMYLREDSAARRVYVYTTPTDPEIVLYDFSLQIGDTCPYGRTMYGYTLAEVTTITNLGKTRRQFLFTRDVDGQDCKDSVIWIEGIGGRELLFPIEKTLPDPRARVICVKNGDEVIYDTSDDFGDTDCTEVTNIINEVITK